MKKALYFVPLLVLLTMADHSSFAQPTVVNSRTRVSSEPHGLNAMVRFFGGGGDMLGYDDLNID